MILSLDDFVLFDEQEMLAEAVMFTANTNMNADTSIDSADAPAPGTTDTGASEEDAAITGGTLVPLSASDMLNKLPLPWSLDRHLMASSSSPTIGDEDKHAMNPMTTASPRATDGVLVWSHAGDTAFTRSCVFSRFEEESEANNSLYSSTRSTPLEVAASLSFCSNNHAHRMLRSPDVLAETEDQRKRGRDEEHEAAMFEVDSFLPIRGDK